MPAANFTSTPSSASGFSRNADILASEASKLGLTFSALSPHYPLLRETQETLAALSLNSPRPASLGVPPVTPAVSAAEPASVLLPPSTPQNSSHEFLINSLQRAYDELLRLWVNTPVVDWSDFVGHTADPTVAVSATSENRRTALVFDPDLLKHVCLCPHGNNPQVHPECPIRIISILERVAISKMQIPSGLVSRGADSTLLPVSSEPICLSETVPLVFYCRIMRVCPQPRVYCCCSKPKKRNTAIDV
ncbi:unnamed protein product [Dibothriocephalus latus]|uniref:Uncharacterized protein n=1 Tax=Dibothriocephalus latus TaxID=60516 RepID=A0A3P7L4D1_DIBLA|nr:unnamed protein product [Dibothriocephalus latus]